MTVLAASQSWLDQPGTTAFLVIFGMGVILVFVFRSMSKHLRKVAMAARAEEEAAARGGGDSSARAAAAQPPDGADSGPASGQGPRTASGRRPAG